MMDGAASVAGDGYRVTGTATAKLSVDQVARSLAQAPEVTARVFVRLEDHHVRLRSDGGLGSSARTTPRAATSTDTLSTSNVGSLLTSLWNTAAHDHRSDSSSYPSTRNGRWFEAETVYVSAGPWDVAILRLRLPAMMQLYPVIAQPELGANTAAECVYRPMSSSSDASDSARLLRSPTIGQRIFVIGHALFGPTDGLRPTVTGDFRCVCSALVSCDATIH